MNKERLERIGKFLNYRMIVHRNVENNTPWTVEEKMIQELYDNYLDLLIKYKAQKEVIDKAVLELANIDGGLSYGQLSDRICNLIDILKEVSE